MSYRVYLKAKLCPTCGQGIGQEPVCPDPTYNLTELFDFALTGEEFPSPNVDEFSVVILREKTDRPRGLRLLDGRQARETIANLNLALDRMTDERLQERFAESVKNNQGWGSVEDGRRILRRLRELAEEYPDNTWKIR